MGDPPDSAQDHSTELQQLRCSALDLRRELPARKSKEAGPSTSPAHFTALSGILQAGLLFEDAARRITFTNERFCAMFGVSGPDCLIGLEGRDAAELVHTVCVDPARILSQIERAVTEQLPVTGEEIRLADGRWLEWGYAPVIVDGVCAGHVWSYRDMTERKRMEMALRESEARLRQVTENIQEVFWLTDLSKNQMVYVSPAYERIWGRTPESLYQSPRSWLEAIHPEDRERIVQAAQTKQVEGTYDEEYRILKPDGSVRWIRDRAFPVRDDSGVIRRIAGLAEDITERKRAEALLQAQKYVLELVASGAPLRETLDTLVRLIEAQSDGMLGSILLLDEEGLHLRHGASPRLPEEYIGAIDGIAVGPSVGSCGTAAFRREPVLVEDIAADPLWDNYRHLALPHGLRACWSTPIVSKDTSIVGTFALYYREPRSPRPHDLQIIEHATRVAAIAIDRERAERRLAASEERFRSLYDDNPSMYFTVAPDGTVLSVNRFGAQQLGYQPNDLIGRSVSALFHEDDQEAARQGLAKAFADPTRLMSLEFRKVTREGAVMWVRELVRVLPAAGTGPVALIVCEDITERKEALLRLAQQESLLRSILDAEPECIKRVAADGTLLQMNEAGLCFIEAESFGEVAGRSVFDLVAPEFLELFRSMHEAVLQGVSQHLEFQIVGLKGTRRWMETHAVPLWNPINHRVEHLAITRDITERKRAEQALRTSAEKLRQALQSSRTGLWDWNTETEEVFLSREWKRQLGYDETELPDTFETWESRLHSDDHDRAMSYVRAYLATPVGDYAQEFRLRHKDGTYRWIAAHASFITEPDGRRMRLLGSHTDITERKQVEEALRRLYEERERVSQDLHDSVLQSLYAVGLGLEATKRDVKPASPAVVRRLNGAVVQLNALIQEVRGFIAGMRSTSDNGKNLVQAIQALTGLFVAMGAGEIAVRIDPSVAVSFSAEQCAHLVNVVKEALSNSVRHAHATHRFVTLGRSRGGIRLEIRDDGIGFRVSRRRGTGMGLANMKARARTLGGRLRIHSKPGQGTCVVLYFRLAPREVSNGTT